jgi:hypothetical protein
MAQITNTILMIRPAVFRMNEETAVNNYFQNSIGQNAEKVIDLAKAEFDAFVHLLRGKGVQIIVVEDDPSLDTPDSIFPNNWISFHADARVALYPMFAANRRRERREEVLAAVEQQGFVISNIMDYTDAEVEGVFLEGTGSMILDRENHTAYCALSPRADQDLFLEFCDDFDYYPVVFNALQTIDQKRVAVYHTNVVLCLGEAFAVICLSCIDNTQERKTVMDQLKADGKEIIDITQEQMHQFAGNMLQVLGSGDKRYIVMSQSALDSLTLAQRKQLEKHGELLAPNLPTIETCGGGSARCMMAEVFLPKS